MLIIGSVQLVNIGALIHYPIPPHIQKAYAGLSMSPESSTLTRQLADEVVSLPISPHLAKHDFDTAIMEARNAA